MRNKLLKVARGKREFLVRTAAEMRLLLEDDTCLRSVFGLRLAHRLTKPQIYDLAGFSLWRGNVLGLAGEVRSKPWINQRLPRGACVGSLLPLLLTS